MAATTKRKKYQKVLRHLHFNPRCKFETASAVQRALRDFSYREQQQIIRWVFEHNENHEAAAALRGLR